MPWFSAHAIMYFEILEGPQDRYEGYENVFLVQADSPDQARDKAEAIARRDEGDSRGTLRLGERPARLVYGSIRKVVSILHERRDQQLGEGDELTYSEFVVEDKAALDKLIHAEDVELLYIGNDADE